MAEEMGNNVSDWSKTYEGIKDKHDKAFMAIDEAITLEEQEKPNEAIDKYKEGIQLIDQALTIQVSCPDDPDITWEKARVMIQKIKKTRAEVLMRINSIQTSPNFVPTPQEEQPPSYDEAMSSSSESEAPPRTYRDLAAALQQLQIDPNKMQEEIVYVHDGIRIYFISASGEVRAIREPQTLKIYMVAGEEANAPRAILEVGDWIYPLVPGVSPCYRTDYGAFILPDVDEPGSSVGIILPSDADAEVFDLLENILHGIISQETENWQLATTRDERAEDLSTKISRSLVNGAWLLSQGLIKGAEKTGEFLNYGTPKIINHMKASERPKAVPPKLSKGIEIAENATSGAVVVTGFIADKVGAATTKLGQFLAPHIQRQGTRLLASGFQMSEQEASDKMKGVLTVAAGAVEGFSTVYRGLETSAGILGTSLKDNTVKVVNHKYGRQAGNITGETLQTVGNVYTISRNSRLITPKGLAKRTGKDMGKALVNAYAHHHHQHQHSDHGPSSSNARETVRFPTKQDKSSSPDLSPTEEKKHSNF